VQPQNHRIYGRSGFSMIWNALHPGGTVAFWAAAVEPGFERKLRREGFAAGNHSIKAHERAKKPIHWIYIGTRPVHTGEGKAAGAGAATKAAPVKSAGPAPAAVKAARKPKRRWY
jgi:hypothetical protein